MEILCDIPESEAFCAMFLGGIFIKKINLPPKKIVKESINVRGNPILCSSFRDFGSTTKVPRSCSQFLPKIPCI